MTQVMEPPAVTLLRLINGYQVSQAIHAAAVLGIADIVGEQPVATEDIAARVGADRQALHRLLRALTTVGIFHQASDREFTASPLSELLRTDHPRSIKGWAVFAGGQDHWYSWGELVESVRTGRDSFRNRFGVSVWDYRAQHSGDTEVFSAAMAALSGTAVQAIIAAFDFGRFNRIVDVGGADGFLLAAILSAYPGPVGVVFDLPHVVAGAEALIAASGLDGRLEAAGGSYFESIPRGGDAYLMKSVLHDCSDEECVQILGSARRAMDGSGALLVIEAVLGDPAPTQGDAFSDVNMLVNTGGRERTGNEWTALLRSGGFNLEAITPTQSRFHVIEGRPIA